MFLFRHLLADFEPLDSVLKVYKHRSLYTGIFECCDSLKLYYPSCLYAYIIDHFAAPAASLPARIAYQLRFFEAQSLIAG